MTPLLWALLLIIATISIIFLEMFVPSGGILGALAGVCAVVAVAIVFYYEGVTQGLLFLVLSAVVIPICVAGALKYWPYTPIGRRILNLTPGETEAVGSPDYQHLQDLIGRTGIAKSKMVPSGSISLSGESFDAVSQSGVIEEGEPIRVVTVDGTRIMVRKIDQDATLPERESPNPAEKIVDDPFSEPLI